MIQAIKDMISKYINISKTENGNMDITLPIVSGNIGNI